MPLRLSLSALILLALSVPAFWPKYLSRLHTADAYTHTHAVLGTTWLLLLIIQPLLVHTRRVRTHRLVGRVAAGVGVAFVLASILLAHRGAVRMSPEDFARFGFFLYLPLSMAVIFAAALGLGVMWRRVPVLHGRFMACTALPLLDPLFARLLDTYFPPLPIDVLYQVPAFALAGIVLAGLSRSLPRAVPGRRSFHAFAAGTALVLLAFFFTPSSSTWFAFVTWFRGLPLT